MFFRTVDPVWLNFVEQLLKNAFVSPNLTAHLLDRCSDGIVKDINSRFPLCQMISEKIDWNVNEADALSLLKLLIKFTAMFSQQITDFYKVQKKIFFKEILYFCSLQNLTCWKADLKLVFTGWVCFQSRYLVLKEREGGALLWLEW